jgi:two-component system response regulator FixJ
LTNTKPRCSAGLNAASVLATAGTKVHSLARDSELAADLWTRTAGGANIRVATYESAVAFLRALPDISPGCIVTDVRMPEMSGVELLRYLKDAGVSLPVIVITGHGDVPLAVEAMRLGAVDFLEKPFDDDILIAAVRSALARLQELDRGQARKAEVQERLATLSARERQVLDGLVAGNPNKTIAHDLGISPRTVEIYRANVMSKTSATSLSDLVRMALVAGVLDEPDTDPAKK